MSRRVSLFRLNEYQSKYPSSVTNNKVYIRLDRNFMIQPDAKLFPLYCTSCGKCQQDLYVHAGSHYGYVGSCNCAYCGKNIDVSDGDNVVLFIRTEGAEIRFDRLYLIDWKYIEDMGRDRAALVERELKQHKGRFIYLDELCGVIENTLNIKIQEKYSFSTDDRYLLLPEDVNRWINLLYAAGVKLPDYVKMKKIEV